MLRALCALLLLLPLVSANAQVLVVRGLFNQAAVIDIDGQQRLLKVGKTDVSGVKLVSADSRQAVVVVAGERRVLRLNTRVGGQYREAASQSLVLRRSANSEYRTRVRVNGVSVAAVIDTGASKVSMSSADANRLNVAYRDAPVTSVATAAGISKAHTITINTLAVGSITQHYVPALVIEGAFPHIVLLGMSFLAPLNMSERDNILTLTPR